MKLAYPSGSKIRNQAFVCLDHGSMELSFELGFEVKCCRYITSGG